jgi:hypothetical protein
MKVFWSWQFDTPGKIGRHFIRDALNAAIEQLKEAPDIAEPIEREARSQMHLDQDRKGISGSPDLARVILEKIEQAAVFVADVTAVGIVQGRPADTPPKKLINPNVAIELGYSLHSLSDRALLMVMNEHYGSRADLPFDLQSKAGPIMFRLAPDADRRTIATEARQLTARLVEALEPFIGRHVESTRQQRPFPEAQAKDGPARFRAPGQPLGIRDGAGFIDAGAGNDIFLAAGAAVWLRVTPTFDPGKKWSSAELKAAANSGINLPPLIGLANGMHTIRAEDGVGTCVIHTAQEQQTDYVAFAFETGEIWAISTYPLRTHPNDLFAVDIENQLREQLPRYGQFLKNLGLQPPYKWIAGVSGVRGRELQYPVAPNTMRIPGWGSHKCASDNISDAGSYDMAQSPIRVLLPFFQEVYNKCGMARPDHLPTE